ncbi:MAG: PAS domain-containing protein, partial [Caldimonas sp.]
MTSQPDPSPSRREEEVAAALRESEARYRMALTAGRMGSWETDLVARTRTWSKEGMDLFGLDLADGRGQVGGAADEYESALHPEDRHFVRRYHELADRQDSFFAEYRIVRLDGSTLWRSGRGLVVERQPDGRARRLVSIMADVTERRQAEEVLRIERERLALALKAGQMGVYDYDMVNDVLWWSPETYVVFGVDPERFVPTRASVGELIHHDDRAGFLERRAQAIAERRPFIHEFRIVRPDGKVLWISHRGQADYDNAGNPVRNFGVSLDITERKHAEEALRDADRKKDDFIATLAHELRNPLAPIRNAVSVLRQNGQADPGRVGWCRDVIDRQVTQMSRLLEDLLDVSRMTRGQFALRREPLLLGAVVAQAIEIAQPLIDAAAHKLTVAMPAEPVAIEGDLARLAQVFSNLLINAAKYTQPAGAIGLAVELQGSEVELRVTDNGVGVGAEQMPRIFEMFSQAAPAPGRLRDGLGIGLALARGFVEMHGGRISVRSDGIGKGSEFVVRLPLARPLDPAGSLEPAVSGRAAPLPGAARCRVLVADDLRDSADSLALLLESMGHEVQVAYDGEHALQAAETFRPEVMLLDLGMPRLSGYEVCRRIRQRPWGGQIKLVAQSGWGHEIDRQRTREAGFDRHL